ncbi:LPS-assembly protein LptD [Pararhodobacter marinus]|uniref:LPS-assembly protein LptD n=2 Tax=Pararhodobacter marinus TaxID=2184063 RepID=UPI00351726BC
MRIARAMNRIGGRIGNRATGAGAGLRSLALIGATLMATPAIVPATAALLASARPAAAQVPATLMADQVYVDETGRLIATGAVEIWHGSIRMTAERVSYDRANDSLLLNGPLTISDGPDTVLLADAAELSPSLRAGIVTSARLVLDQQFQISAARIERGTNRVSQMDQVLASSCPVCATNPTPLWEIRAERVIHDEPGGRLAFDHAQFRIAGVPVFYLPRLVLPAPGTNRLRGFLRPEFTMDSDLGFTAGIPYFIPLGERQDLTLTPRVSTEGMVSLGFRWRHASRRGGIEIGGQVSRDDLTAADLRGYGYVRALFHLQNDWVLTADVLAASDRTYLETYSITDDARLHGHVTLERIRRNEAQRLRALGFYSLRAGDINARQPNVALQAESEHHYTLGGGDLALSYGARGFERASTLDGRAGRDVARAHVELGWRRSGVLPGGLLATAALNGRVDHVRIDDDIRYLDPVTRGVAQAMVELRWPWMRVDSGGARHVIEPVVQVISSERSGERLPNDDHTMPELDAGNLFAFHRYVGTDAPDDGSRVNAGLRWARHDPASGWSTEALIGRIWRSEPLAGYHPAHLQPLGRATSDWLLAGRVSHTDGYAFTLRMAIDPETRNLSRGETNLSWTRGRTDLSTTYLYVPASRFEDRAVDLSEWSVDIGRRFGNGWSTTLGWDYDIGQNLFATARAGFAFVNECLSFELTMARRFVTATNPSSSTRFDMRVELLGIGGAAPSDAGRTCRT